MIASLVNRIDKYNKSLKAISKVSETIDKIVSENKDVLLSLNRDQMLLGRNTQGESLAPTYLDDPYFKTQKAAKAYANMKYNLESRHKSMLWTNEQLYPTKAKDAPNLIVTGSFQDAMFVTIGGGSYTIGSNYKESQDIESKYNNLIFGLAPKSKEYFYQKYIKDKLIKSLSNGM